MVVNAINSVLMMVLF